LAGEHGLVKKKRGPAEAGPSLLKLRSYFNFSLLCSKLATLLKAAVVPTSYRHQLFRGDNERIL